MNAGNRSAHLRGNAHDIRSHLGILTREYGIPCFMNSKISGIREGDIVRHPLVASMLGVL